jgi:hypothetical protein
MFGKTKDHIDTGDHGEDDLTVDDFFGDEAAVAEAVRVDHLQQRVTQVEQQINSQFTSLAAYAQIAQEQVEMVRSEALHASERSEQKVIALIERERGDRINESNGGVDVTARLDAMDAQIAEIRQGLQLCLSNQKALADAITDLFRPQPSTEATEAQAADPEPEPAPAPVPVPETRADDTTFAFEAAQPVYISDEAPALGTLPPPAAGHRPVEPTEFAHTGLADGPIEGLSLD